MPANCVGASIYFPSQCSYTQKDTEKNVQVRYQFNIFFVVERTIILKIISNNYFLVDPTEIKL